MPQLNWRFAISAITSVLLGARELYLAWVLVARPQMLSGYITEAAMASVTFEAVFLVVGGLFLILWPIAYRKLQWVKV